MAQGLRCPNCGHKHPVSQLPGTPTFHCAGCGQVLKTPREYRKPEPAAPRAVRAAPEHARPVPPRPRAAPDREPGPARVAARAPVEATEAMPAVAPVPPARAARPAPAPRAPRPARPPSLPVAWRVLIWVVALPVGLGLVGLIARWIGVLNGNSLFDIISGSGIGRYVRVFAIAPFAALVIATIAHVSLERLPVMLERRRAAGNAGARTARGSAGDNGHRDPAEVPVGRAGQRAGRPAGRRPTP